MGGPRLEVMRMAVYISFPVAIFYYFNLPEFYTDNVKTKLVRTSACPDVCRCVHHTSFSTHVN